MADDYELLASVLRKFKAGYFHLFYEEPWTDDDGDAGGGWRFTIDHGVDLTDEEAEAVQRALNDGVEGARAAPDQQVNENG